MRSSRALAMLVFFAISFSTAAQTAPAGDAIIERVSPAVALILVGSGNGQLDGIGSGLIVRSDGVLLTANHVVKGMKEVQVRLKNGEIYDRVELIASDERRDIAALRVPAKGLTVLPTANADELRAGAPVFVVSNGAGLPWTASAGILSAMRMADDVPGAGSGYRLLQITAPLSPGASGGVVVDGQGRAVAIVTGALREGQNNNFAVPVDSVAGLASVTGGTAFASGARLQLPSAPQPGATATRDRALPAAAAQPVEVPRNSQIRTISVHSRTVYLRRERLQNDLKQHPLFAATGLRFADYGETADVQITVDRPFLTYDWTYTLVHQASGTTLAAGSIEAVDEYDAGPALAARIMELLAAAAALPRNALAEHKAVATQTEPPRSEAAAARNPVDVLRTCRAIFVESHTIYLKGNQLQDALYVRPELRDWGMKIVDDRAAADVYIDVTRPFLTFDWVYKMIDTRSGAVLATGKVIAWDGPIAAPQLAVEIMKHFRSARPGGTKDD